MAEIGSLKAVKRLVAGLIAEIELSKELSLETKRSLYLILGRVRDVPTLQKKVFVGKKGILKDRVGVTVFRYKSWGYPMSLGKENSAYRMTVNQFSGHKLSEESVQKYWLAWKKSQEKLRKNKPAALKSSDECSAEELIARIQWHYKTTLNYSDEIARFIEHCFNERDTTDEAIKAAARYVHSNSVSKTVLGAFKSAWVYFSAQQVLREPMLDYSFPENIEPGSGIPESTLVIESEI